MRTLILYLIFIGVFISAAIAQENQEIYPQQASIDHNQAVKNFSSDYMSALQNNSQLNLQQLSDGISSALINVEGNENLTVLSQQGYGIVGLIDIKGHNNQTSMQQNGSNLLSVLEIEGHSNKFDMKQTGNNLQNYFQIFSSDANFELQQNNSGMQFRQSGTGTIPLSIQQSSSKPIIIRNN